MGRAQPLRKQTTRRTDTEREDTQIDKKHANVSSLTTITNITQANRLASNKPDSYTLLPSLPHPPYLPRSHSP